MSTFSSFVPTSLHIAGRLDAMANASDKGNIVEVSHARSIALCIFPQGTDMRTLQRVAPTIDRTAMTTFDENLPRKIAAGIRVGLTSVSHKYCFVSHDCPSRLPREVFSKRIELETKSVKRPPDLLADISLKSSSRSRASSCFPKLRKLHSKVGKELEFLHRDICTHWAAMSRYRLPNLHNHLFL